jgi:PAS domain S-box-containing protein
MRERRRWVRPGAVRMSATYLAQMALLAAVYLAGAKAAFALAFVHTSIAPVWPPSGIALAAVLRFGKRAAPGVFLGALLFNALTPVPLQVSAALAVGNTLEAVAGAWLLRRAGFHPATERVRDVLALAGLAALGATAISASVGVVSLLLSGLLPGGSAALSWMIWWLGDASGVLTAAPLLLLGSAPASWRRLSLSTAVEAIGLAATLTLSVGALLAARSAWSFLMFPALVWAAVRFRPTGAAVVSLLVSAVVVWWTTHDHGPFGIPSADQGLLLTQTFTVVVIATSLFLAALTVEREHALQTLRESEERFRLLIEGVHDHAIFLLDPDGRVASWNEGATRLMGYTTEEILGESIARFHLPEDVAAGVPERTLAQAIASGRCEDEGWRLRKEGSPFWANVMTTALYDQRGNLRGFSKVTRDFTERRRTEEAIRRSEDFRHASEIKSEFLGVMSHELRTPLSAMLISAEMLDDPSFGPLTEAKARNLGARLTASGRHLLALIDDLLDLSRIEAGQLDLAIVPTALGPLLREIHQSVASTASEQGVLLDIPAGVRGRVLADPLRLRQVLLNLLVNAIKFTEAGGRVWLQARSVDDEVVLHVRDTGAGMAPEDLDRMFLPFEKGSAVTAGAGLGLAIAKRLVELQHGSLEVASTVGEGTTFTVTLPAARPGRDDAAAASPQRTAHMPGERAVLVVEDDPALLDLTALVLESGGLTVDRAASVADALDAITRDTPALVLLDLSLGNGDGLEVVRHMRAEPSTRGVPVLALSARVARSDVERALAAGCEAHLAKPIGARELLNRVRQFLPSDRPTWTS